MKKKINKNIEIGDFFYPVEFPDEKWQVVKIGATEGGGNQYFKRMKNYRSSFYYIGEFKGERRVFIDKDILRKE